MAEISSHQSVPKIEQYKDEMVQMIDIKIMR